CRHVDSDANESAACQQAIGAGPAAQRGSIDIVIAVGAIISSEYRIEAICRIEAGLDTVGSHRPTLIRLMTRRTRSTISPEVLKERIGQVKASGRTESCRLPA